MGLRQDVSGCLDAVVSSPWQMFMLGVPAAIGMADRDGVSPHAVAVWALANAMSLSYKIFQYLSCSREIQANGWNPQLFYQYSDRTLSARAKAYGQQKAYALTRVEYEELLQWTKDKWNNF